MTNAKKFKIELWIEAWAADMSAVASALRGIAIKVKLSNVIAAAALILSLPAISISINQIMEKDESEKENKNRISQIEKQIAYAREQVEQSKLQSEAAKLSASAAASSATKLRQQNQFAERSLLIQRYTSYQASRPRIEFIEVDKITLSETDSSKWVARFAKTGTPPSNVRIWIFSEVKPAGSQIPDYPQCQSAESYINRGSFQKGAIFANGQKITQEQSKMLAVKQHLFVMGGRICYNDDDGGWHATDFCISAHGTNENWSYDSCSGANSS